MTNEPTKDLIARLRELYNDEYSEAVDVRELCARLENAQKQIADVLESCGVEMRRAEKAESLLALQSKVIEAGDRAIDLTKARMPGEIGCHDCATGEPRHPYCAQALAIEAFDKALAAAKAEPLDSLERVRREVWSEAARYCRTHPTWEESQSEDRHAMLVELEQYFEAKSHKAGEDSDGA